MKPMRNVISGLIATLGLTAFGTGADGLHAVEYLESTGVQWIDTGLNADSKLSVEIKCQFLTVNSADQNIFGALAGDSSNQIRHHLTARVGVASSGEFHYMVRSSERTFGDSRPLEPHIHFFDAQNKTYSFDGRDTDAFQGIEGFDCHANYYLFGRNALNYTGLNNVTLGRARLYYAKFWRFENGQNTLVGDFVPAIDANGVGCLYDYVSGQPFYDASVSGVPFAISENRLGPISALPSVEMVDVTTTADSAHVRANVRKLSGTTGDLHLLYGTGPDALTEDVTLAEDVGLGIVEADLIGLQNAQTYYARLFVVSEETSGEPCATFSFTTKATDGFYPLPLDYEAVQCITVTDVGQYIDTGYKPTSKTDVDLKCEVPDFKNLTSIYWTRDGSICSFGLIFVAGNFRTIRAYKLSNGTTSDVTTLGSDLVNPITYTTSGDKLTINGLTTGLASPTANQLDNPIYIFGLNDAGKINPAATVVGTKLHYLTLTEDGIVVRMFVPCKNDQGVAGLFERVYGKFYPNSGTGGNFGFNPLSEVEVTTLTITGDPSQVGSPEPNYGFYEPTSGQEIVVTMDVTAVTNYLTGEERYLEGWELTVRKESGSTVVTTSEGGDIRKCVFTPEKNDQARLKWIWSRDPYGGNVLPDEYEALDALDFDGHSFVNTKLLLSLDDRLVDVIGGIADSGGTKTAFCAREYNSDKPQCVLFDSTGRWRFDYGSSSDVDLADAPTGQQLALAVNAGGFYQNGELVRQNAVSSAQTPGPLVLQASYWYGDEQWNVFVVNNFLRSDLFVVRVWDKDGVPRANLLPCQRKADGVKGLYDTVRRMFCPRFSKPRLTVVGNPVNFPDCGITYGTEYLAQAQFQGTDEKTGYKPLEMMADGGEKSATGGQATYRVSGWKVSVTDFEGNVTETENDAANVTTCTFAAHYGDTIRLEWQFATKYAGKANAHIRDLRYDEVAWLKFDSNTLVNTDYTPAPDKVKAAVSCEIVDGDHTQAIFCSRTGPKSNSYTLFYYKDDQNPDAEGLMSMRVKSEEGLFSSAAEILGKRVKFETDLNRIRIDNGEWTTVGTFDAAFTKTGNPLSFGASYSESQGNGVGNYGAFKLYSAKFWENDVLVHSFVPCHDKCTNVSGFYDVVTGKFYGCVNANKNGVRLEEGPHVGCGMIITFW